MSKKNPCMSLLPFGLYINACAVLCFSSTFLNSADQVAIVGGEATLPCNFTLPSPDDSIFLIFWYRGASRSPFYTVDARFGPLLKAKHFTRGVFQNRFQFNLSSQPPILKIFRIQEGDEGEYKCRVDYRWARTQTVAVGLRVIVPPTSISIMSAENDEHLFGDIGPYNEGSELRLICRSGGGRPAASVTWKRTGEIIDSTFILTENGTSENELVLHNLHRSDLLAKLTCQASNNNATKPLMTSVVIDLNLKPLEVLISTSSRPFTAGERAELVCEASGARPPAHIVWYRDHQEIFSVAESWARGNVTSSKLIIRPTKEDDGKDISCRADNPNIPNSAKEAGLQLSVYYKPIVTVSLAKVNHKSEIYEESTAELMCNITSNPWVLDVAWYFNGQPLRPNIRQGVAVKNFTLFLQNVTRHQSGNYQCSATNVVGKGTSAVERLSVMFSPVCNEGQKIVYGVSKGKNVKVICDVSAEPEDITFFWIFNSSSSHKRHISTFFSHKLRSIATYKPYTIEDYGSLYCWARNVVGVQREPCIFSIVPAGPPDQVKHCAFQNVTVETVAIVCDVEDERNNEIFTVEVKDSNRLVANVTAFGKAEFVVTGLPAGTPLLFSVFATNSIGRSEAYSLETKTRPQLADDTEGTAPKSMGAMLEITVGCVSGLVVLACIGIVILRKVIAENKNAAPKNESKARETDRDTQEMHGPDVIPLAGEWTGFPGEPSDWTSYNGYQVTCSPYDIHKSADYRRKQDTLDGIREYRLKSTLV